MKASAAGALLAALISISFILPSGAQEAPRSRESFNEGWRFIKFFHARDEIESTDREPEALHLPSVSDENWRSLDLPHDWAVEGPFSDTLENNTGLLPWKGVGWYRKHFTLNSSDKGNRIYVDFDGAMAYSEVWINGEYAGGWPYGYTSFRLDLTPYVKFGEDNLIAVRLNTRIWDSRWYPGAGIYRNVWLVKTGQLHVKHNGIFCTTPEIKKESAVLSVQAEVESHYDKPVPVSIKAFVYKLGDDGNPLAHPVAESGLVAATIPASADHIFRIDIPVSDPVRWDIEDPQLYRTSVAVYHGETLADVCETNFGFRTLEFTARDGFFLNGRKVEIKGVCNHHDLGALGAAFSTRAAERQLEILKEMGCNAIRTSHNPPAPELLDLCDRMGFLVEDEAFDTWKTPKKQNDYNKLFYAWHEEDLRAMVRRDRNHPSVFIWSTGNEVNDQNNPALSESLRAIVKSEDITRPVTVGCNWDESGTNGFQKTVDLFGINYRLYRYEAFFAHEENGNLPFHSSESASTVSSRGEYFFPVVEGDLNNNLPENGIFQISSYDLAYPAWASTADQQWEMIDRFPGVFGEFVWTGFDYLGEPTPYGGDLTGLQPGTRRYEQAKALLDRQNVTEVPSRSSYFGIIDLAGFKKDRFWLYQSKWRPDLPSAHILPHWNWPERRGQITPVHVYTSGDEAELFHNGKSMGRKKKGEYEYRLRWDDVVYQPGELKVIAWKNGEKWAEERLVTTGKAAKLGISADREIIKSDGSDLVFIAVTIEDKKGLVVPRSSNLINFSIEGPGKIVAVDNGDATNHNPFQASSGKSFNGMCLVIVKAEKGAAGSFTVRVASRGLLDASVGINIADKP
ncbi:MAG: beta-galactosidase GalB [Bacteroidales bacterium]|jgi:beta-galactosidase|nr:beta-galactosidase GalB [Bacteroidales bacterium]